MGARAAQGGNFEQALLDGSIQLVKSSYFESCLTSGRPFQKQQDIPAEYVWSGATAVKHWKYYGAFFLVIVSYCWLSPGHPDPNMFHLRRFCKFIKALKEYLKDQLYGRFVKEVGDLALIVDFCAFPQKESDGADLRSAAQLRQFKAGLKEINTAYVHNRVMCWRFQHVPPAEPRAYDDRGWTLFEKVISDCKTKSTYDIVEEIHDTTIVCLCRTTVVVLGDAESMDKDAINNLLFSVGRMRREPPLTPARFEAALEQRRTRAEARGLNLFTNGKEDHDFVKAKYMDFYHLHFARSSKLDFYGCGFGPEDALPLAEVLEDCEVLEEIVLAINPFGDRGRQELDA